MSNIFIQAATLTNSALFVMLWQRLAKGSMPTEHLDVFQMIFKLPTGQ